MVTLLAAETKSASGAALSEVIIGGAIFTALFAVTILLAYRERQGKPSIIGWAGDRISRINNIPAWATFPQVFLTGSLMVAVFGMYWDISLHIDQGRDPGPLANPAHYWILFGLFGIVASGVAAASMSNDPLPARTLKLTENWRVPLGAVAITICGAISLGGFPLDDIWHRIFGQDVTLFGPTHLMLIGGAGLSTLGGYLLLIEGYQAAPGRVKAERFREVATAGALLIGLSTFQAEFDFGVPQFPMPLEMVMIMGAGAIPLVLARLRVGAGAAIGAVLVFYLVRGGLTLIVGGLFGNTMPHFPLYMVSALLVEGLALVAGTRLRGVPFGAVAGLLIGTIGLASEFAWSHVWAVLPWPTEVISRGGPWALLTAVAAGMIGGWIAEQLNRVSDPEEAAVRAPRPAAIGRVSVAVAFVAILVAVGFNFPYRAQQQLTAQVSLTDVTTVPFRTVQAEIRVDPKDVPQKADWFTITAWQGGASVVEKLTRVEPGVYRTNKPVPVYGNWKSTIRYASGNNIQGVPIFFPRDDAIPAPEVRADPTFTRTFLLDKKLLQREQKPGVPTWLTWAAYLSVAALALFMLAVIAWSLRTAAGRGRISGPRGPNPTRTSVRGSAVAGAQS
ncbi:MAG: hypothetical protein QOJ32_779 [Frankiaceae bacterium]|nr:hypothetical protein [Frankiaceae bacterium]